MSSSPRSFKNEGDPSAASFVSFPCLSKQLRLQIAHALNAMSSNALLSILLGAAELCEKSDPQMKEKQTNSTLALKTPCPSPAQINPMGRL